MKAKSLLTTIAAALLSGSAFCGLPHDVSQIALQGQYKGHLQDVWYDGGGFLYWAHTLDLQKTDLSGRIVKHAKVEGHHAGIEVRDGRVYVAVCPMQSTTNGKTTPDCRVTINEYDADTLKLLKRNVTDINDRSGSLAILEDGTFLVGCLRPQDIKPTQVRFHHLDRDYRLIRSYVLDDVPVVLGIEVIKVRKDGIYLCMYNFDDKLPYDCIKLDFSFKEVWRGKLPGACGLVFDGEDWWCGVADKYGDGTGPASCSGRLVRTSGPQAPGATGLPQVRLKGSLGERFDLTVTNNYLKLALEKDFFRPFRARQEKEGFIGLGKLADAAVHLAWNSKDPAVIARKDEIIGFIIDNQLPDGYTGCLEPTARLGKLWDIHEMGFIIQGLISEWELFGNRKALEAARRNVDFVIDRWKTLPENWEMTFITDRETTLGFGYGVARLYAATKDEKYRLFLRNERSLDVWNQPIVVGRDKMIYGQAYGYLGTCLEQLELYRYDPRPRYLETSMRALDFMTKGNGLLINGTGGIAECWTDDQDGEGAVGETCMVAFQLLFYDELIRLGVGDPALLGDLMERAIYNALFAAQSRDGRKLRYYTPLNGERKFWPNDLYCCPNNFRRAIGRLPEYVFYVKGSHVTANLYTACEATLDVDGTALAIREETDYPRSGKVRFEIDPVETKSFDFAVRVPRWCRTPSAKINGMPVTYKYRPGEILHLTRVWRKGDTLELDFPMEVRTVLGRKRQSGRFAVMRGPVVYAMDTRKVDAFKGLHPWDVQSEMMMDSTRLSYSDGKIMAFVSTQNWAVGVDDVSVDGKVPENVRKVELVPFEDEDNTLTYFRAPNIGDSGCIEDGLFVRGNDGNEAIQDRDVRKGRSGGRHHLWP